MIATGSVCSGSAAGRSSNEEDSAFVELGAVVSLKAFVGFSLFQGRLTALGFDINVWNKT